LSYLNDTMLIDLCENHQLVTPYDPARVNPASIDLALGREFVNLSDSLISYWFDHPDPHEEGGWNYAEPGERFKADKVELRPNRALLATTAERVAIPASGVEVPMRFTTRDGVSECVASRWIEACTGELRLKSSAARNGLDHALAGWIDPGFDGTLTLELHAHRPIELLAGKCYVQLVVATMLAAPARSYQQTGRYVGESAVGAVLAKEDR